MSDVKYIISCRNPSKCLPDTLYYCSAKAGIANAKRNDDIIYDIDSACARVFTSAESVARTVSRLNILGVHQVQVLQKIIKLEPVDTRNFSEIITKQKIKDILNTIPDDDIDFLVKHADLDLTSVT